MAKKKYEGKYAEMAEQFRKDGCDEYTVEKFIRREMEYDEFEKGRGTTDIEAVRIWKEYPDEVKEQILNNAFCDNCWHGVFAPGYNIRMDKFGIVIEGECKNCGAPMIYCDY